MTDIITSDLKFASLKQPKPLVNITSEGEVQWGEGVAPSDIMDPTNIADGHMRASILALWYATH